MEGKGSIFDYRSRMDKTLASPDLTNNDLLRTLVKNQIIHTSHFPFEEYVETVVERKTEQVANFLGMLRSVSATDGGWKVKQDTEELRVMYREGPEGSPFHTLLAEGYVDGPVDVCLCISYESGLYGKWWPQMAVPTFKIVTSQCLKRVSTFEQISLVRMKVPWPLSGREALIHYLSFEYFQDGLIVVLLNSISDPETVDISTHGFTRDGIPEAQDVVRIDVVGGFALQKVSVNRSYFRTIANMDIKLDFIPPALINFISRQLIGSGFKLYKKEVASVALGDEEFGKALKDPLYTRIREALYSEKTSNQENINESISIMLEEQKKEASEDSGIMLNNISGNSGIASKMEDFVGESNNEIEEVEETDADGYQSANESTHKSSDRLISEITEEITGENEGDGGNEVPFSLRTTNEIKEYRVTEMTKKKVVVSPEVEQALRTLDKAISALREYKRVKYDPEKAQSDVNKRNLVNSEDAAAKESKASVNSEEVAAKESKVSPAKRMIIEKEECKESSETGSTSSTSEIGTTPPLNSSDNHVSRVTVSSSYPREAKQSKIAPASPVEEPLKPPMNQKTDFTIFERNANHQSSSDPNGVKEDRDFKRASKKSKFGCFGFTSRR